jgi:hypothetical protein
MDAVDAGVPSTDANVEQVTGMSSSSHAGWKMLPDNDMQRMTPSCRQ